MLPAGTTAELASYADQQTLKALHPSAQTVARILVGRCSCDLVRERARDTREDERHLRQRYRALRLTRTHVIQSLDRHRVERRLDAPNPARWPEALAGFVTEHARNAGPTLYLLHFGFHAAEAALSPQHSRLQAGQVRQSPREWLAESTPTLVS